MPTSSTSKQSRLGGVLNKKRHFVSSTTFWSPNNKNNNNNNNSSNNHHQPDERQVGGPLATAVQTRAPESTTATTTTFQSKNSKLKKSTVRGVLASVGKDQHHHNSNHQNHRNHQHHHHSQNHLDGDKRQLEIKHAPSQANQFVMASSADVPAMGAFSLQADQAKQPKALSLAGQLVLTGSSGGGGAGKQPNSLGAPPIEQVISASYTSSTNSNRLANNRGQLGAHVNKAYLNSNPGLNYADKAGLAPKSSTSQVSINAAGSDNNNNRLDQLPGGANCKGKLTRPAQATSTSTFTVHRHVNLKYIKTIIILLLAVDLIITVFVHQFSTNDQLTLLWFSSFKMRFSLLNLILSAIWFIILIGAILFDIHFVLTISCCVHIISFFVLLGFSIVHFYRRIDYNTVHLFSLLTLLFSIIVLHVYLLVLTALTYYLMRAVRSRRQPSMGR